MDELERMIFVTNLIWYGSNVLPVIVAVVCGYLIAKKKDSSSLLRFTLFSLLAVFIVGFIGSVAVGQQMLNGLKGAPFDLVEKSCLRMWYPLRNGLVSSISIAWWNL
jgi:TctA family transporter